ncbi:hypothetical protein VA7868_02546 [Vibrio aerogenes CECT 7868]|uniref:DUF1481 domain-containing protein n=2 Tax=Vibrio aerogenes TaxID=92172 RepID=A0A1M5ZC57_9VIBR|nr:hypothetical protein VA7868_02546 [Vibrio aerogenes CECT 7868]
MISWRIFMKRSTFLTCLSILLFGCSSSQHSPSLKKLEQLSGGERVGDAVSLFWYSDHAGSPYSASDYIQSDFDGGYQTSYRWQGSVLKELVREGTQTASENVLVPFKVHIRFDKNGDAVYQQYRLNGKVLPLSAESLNQYKNQANAIVAAVKKQDKQGLELIQGVWHGDHFETCSGYEYERVEFNQTLPGFVINRLSDLDNYMAFLGKVKNKRVYVDELLVLADEEHECIARPNLIPES